MLARQGLALVGLLVALARPPYPWTALLMLGAPLLLTYSISEPRNTLRTQAQVLQISHY